MRRLILQLHIVVGGTDIPIHHGGRSARVDDVPREASAVRVRPRADPHTPTTVAGRERAPHRGPTRRAPRDAHDRSMNARSSDRLVARGLTQVYGDGPF